MATIQKEDMSTADNPQQFRHILVVEDKKTKRSISLEENTYSIGRDSNSSIVIYDHQVSRHHATLLRVTDYQADQKHYRIIDGNLQGKRSTNGLIINGRACLTHELKHGDIIKFGGRAKASYQIITETTNIDVLQADAGANNNEFYSVNEDFKKTLTSNLEFEQLSQEDLCRLASFPELSPNPIIEIDWEGTVTYINPAASAKFRDLNQDLLEHPILAGLLTKPQNCKGNLFVREVVVGQEVFEQYVHFLTESKRIRSYIFDFTKRKQTEAALKESEERYRAVVRQATEGIFLIDVVSKRVIEANTAYCNMLGYTTKEILDLTLYDLIACQQQKIDSNLEQLLSEKQEWVTESIHRSKNNTLVNVEVSTSLIHYSSTEVLCFVVRDITKRKQSEETLQYQAFHDVLTGLPNRALFNEQLTTALANAQRYQHLVAIFFLDLDRFKTVNDTYGHSVGDLLLKSFAQRLKICVRDGDMVARWGGDEFIVLLPRVASIQDTAKISQRILDALKKPFEIEHHTVNVKSSIGISLYPQDGKDADTLLRYADAALLRSKKQGRNNYHFYSTTLNSKTSLLLRLEILLHQALEKQEFSLQYLPQVNINTGKTTSMEALLRWQHAELGQVAPERFISLAEETNLILPIGEWVLRSACCQNRSWQQSGITPIQVAVNLSPQQFQQPNLAIMVAEILQETGLDPQWLELEITEAAITSNPERAQKTLQDLQALGVHLSLDDFGIGNSSIGYLKQLPFKTLKLAQSFIKDLKDAPQDLAIVSTAIALGRGFRLRVVAEGVETVEQFELLRRLHCEEMQGYHLSPPLNAEETVGFLRSARPVQV